MFAGNRARDLVIRYLNDTSNVMNIQSDAHTSYNNLKWGIEARSDGNGKVRSRHLGGDT
jgi:restriction endonuclease S subunit